MKTKARTTYITAVLNLWWREDSAPYFSHFIDDLDTKFLHIWILVELGFLYKLRYLFFTIGCRSGSGLKERKCIILYRNFYPNFRDRGSFFSNQWAEIRLGNFLHKQNPNEELKKK